MAFSQVQTYCAVFRKLRWAACGAANDAGEFVCSDRPVVIQGFQVMPDGDCVVEGKQPKRVYFPIGPTIALIGHCGSDTIDPTLDRDALANLNGRVIDQAERCIFFRNIFFARGTDGMVRSCEEEVQRLTTQ